MAKQLGFYVELDKCVQCHACEVACKSFNDVDLNVKRRRVMQIWSGGFPEVNTVGVSLSCMHCGQPACMEVCPAGAISKRAEDGIVVVDQDKCIGCHYCFFACPFGVPQYGDDGTMDKCNLCLERLEQGMEPSCVKTCPADALHYGTMEELADLAREKVAQRLVGSTNPAVLMTP